MKRAVPSSSQHASQQSAKVSSSSSSHAKVTPLAAKPAAASSSTAAVLSQSSSSSQQAKYSHVKSRIDTGRSATLLTASQKTAAPSSQASSAKSSISSSQKKATPTTAAPQVKSRVASAPIRPPVLSKKPTSANNVATTKGPAATGPANPGIFSIRPQVTYEDFFGVERNSFETTTDKKKQQQRTSQSDGRTSADSLTVSESTYRHHSNVMASVSWQTYVLDEAPDLPPVHHTSAAAAAGGSRETLEVIDAPQVSRIANKSTDSQLSSILEFHRPSRASIVLAALEASTTVTAGATSTVHDGEPAKQKDATDDLLAVPAATVEGRGSFRRSTTVLPQPPNSPTSGAKDPQGRPSRSAGGSGWLSSILSLISGGSIEQEEAPVNHSHNEEQAEVEAATAAAVEPDTPTRPSSRNSTGKRSRTKEDSEEAAPPRRSSRLEHNESLKVTPTALSGAAARDADDDWRLGASSGIADDASPVPQPPKPLLGEDDDEQRNVVATPLTPLAPPSALDKTNWFKRAVQRLSGSRMSEDLSRASEGPKRRKSVVFTEQLEVVAEASPVLQPAIAQVTVEHDERKSATLSPKTNSSKKSSASPQSKLSTPSKASSSSKTPRAASSKSSSGSKSPSKASTAKKEPSRSPKKSSTSPKRQQQIAAVSPSNVSSVSPGVVSTSLRGAGSRSGKSVSPRDVSAPVDESELQLVGQTLRAASASSAMKILTVKQVAAFLASQQISFDPEKKKAQLIALARRAVSQSKSKSRTNTQQQGDGDDDDDEVIDDGPGSPHFRQNETPNASWTVAELKSFASSKRLVIDPAAAKRKADLLDSILVNLQSQS